MEKQDIARNTYYYVASFVLLMLILFYASNLVSQVVEILVQPPVPLIRVNYEDAKAQLLWEKYGPGANGSITPEELKEFVIQRELQYKEVALRHNYSIAVRNAIYLLIMIPVYWHHWKVALSLE